MSGLPPLVFQPIVIIGAGRSGTNMLRDLLTQLPGAGTWPCDEINYIWRHGNVRAPTDALTVEQARPEVRAYIRRRFHRLARRRGLSHVVEKTCANALRVGFVHAVLPEAKFVHIVRDGVDVIASARRRWGAPLDLPYIGRKARFVPPTDVPYYATRFIWNRLYRQLSRDRRLAFWGPIFDGMAEALQSRSLEEVCALQWQHCVECAHSDLGRLPPQQVHHLRYEDLVRDPERHACALAEFLACPVSRGFWDGRLRTITAASVGRGYRDLPPAAIRSIYALVGDTLTSLGYPA
jgi:hypothetical protein